MKIDNGVILRFRAKFKVDKKTKCWVWVAAINKYGYGHFMMRHPKRMVRAHRFSYFYYKGKIPRGKMVLHECDNRACVNPAHLYLGTQFDNMRDALQRGRFCVGVNHFRAVLDEASVRAIRKDKRPVTAIAAAYGLSLSHTRDIRKRRYWRHVP